MRSRDRADFAPLQGSPDAGIGQPLAGFLKTARPIQLFKTVFAVGWGQSCANGNHFVPNVASLVTTIGMVLLWAGLYGLNDLADVDFDLQTVHKRFRPLAAGEIRSRDLVFVTIAEIFAGLLLLSSQSAIVALIGVGLVTNQLLYSYQPFRLKHRFLWDVLSAAVFSHGARFLVGLQGGPERHWVAFAGGALIFWKISAYLAYELEDAPSQEQGRAGTAARLGGKRTTAACAVTILASYCCFTTYAFHTHLPAVATLAFTTMYAVAIYLYVTLFRTGMYPKALEVLVFSAAGRVTPALRKATSA